MLSLSRCRYRGAVSHGKASRNCCCVQAAVGCDVTFRWTMRLLRWLKTTKPKSTPNVAVGMAKKSIPAASARCSRRKRLHVGEGLGGLRRGRYLDTVDCAT